MPDVINQPDGKQNSLPILTVSGLRKRFNLEAGFFARFGTFVYAVNDISFTIHENESYGLVGESGCGKTSTARLLVRMYEADSGGIMYRDGIDVFGLKGGDLRSYRGKIKYVFQDPARSLNPRKNIYEILTAGSRLQPSWPGKRKARKEAAAMLEEVGLSKNDLERKPSEFSGGQRQRISIARGLMMKPELLICDEVVSALDVSIQGQILNLLLDIRQKHSLSFLFIAHDLKVACYFCDRIGVMYQGELMEEAEAKDLYKSALHPYTKLLFSSVTGNEVSQNLPERHVHDAVLHVSTEGTGCAFAPRCPIAEEKCFREHPGIKEIENGHRIRCLML
ncbi:MAG: ABC transporter ATP-binding protein [Treponema sp.]|nr:ABC transporter ATP-binding protein [Treponema sp.]